MASHGSSFQKTFLGGAGSAGGAVLDVDALFSTYLYDGTGSAQTITNGIDLSGEGGLVWIKRRDGSNSHNLEDTARGTGKSINSDTTSAEDDQSGSYGISAFNSNGFSLVGAGGRTNTNNAEYVSWTFRKAPKFFDVVKYTGNGTAGRTVSHNLGSVPGMFIVKEYGASGENWSVYHRGLGATKTISLNRTNTASDSINHWNNTAPTDSVFTLGDEAGVNGNGKSFVAYLFAHNNNDGGFGPDSDADIIKCGDYPTSNSGSAAVTLGFEPQFILRKRVDTADDWVIVDVMRGLTQDDANSLEPNTTDAENASVGNLYDINATGFIARNHAANATYIYMAIRRGPLAAPTDATKVFAIDQQNASEPYLTSGFPVDFAFQKRKDNSSNWMTGSRMQGAKQLNLDLTAAEGNETAHQWDYMDGFRSDGYASDWFGWMWKRAPSYFDVVAYKGTGSNRTISHNLGVVPEMMWVKSRGRSEDWNVYHSAIGNQGYIKLNANDAATTSNTNTWNSTTPTASVFTLGTRDGVNKNTDTFIAYLFATVAGVSKVGSFSGDGNSGRVIDCGFSSGARFVLITSYTHSDYWWVFDSTRGIVAGNDARLFLTSAAQVTNADTIDPSSSGFIVNNTNGELNDTGRSYLFYAIA